MANTQSNADPTVLVVGGAGYVGSHTALALAEAGFRPVVYDNLSNGRREFVRWGPLEVGDIHDAERLHAALIRHRPSAIVHFAGLIEVAESVRDPFAFYRNNVTGALAVLEAAREAGVDAFVFSSTCAVYGDPRYLPMDEDHPIAPASPYGRSKAMVEAILDDAAQAYGLRSVRLRYFNAAGADPRGRIGEWHEPESHAVPLAIGAAMGERPAFKVFGDDYETRDGTCERDYVHVLDLADAHVRAVRHLLDGGEGATLNLGTGAGTTVRELLEAIGREVGSPVPHERAAKRPGDVPALVAHNARARELLGWIPSRGLDDIVRDAVAWHRLHLPVEHVA